MRRWIVLVLAAAGCGNTQMTPTGGDDLSVAVSVDMAGAPASCNDGKKDGDETDVDCGGSCAPCATGKTCAKSSDCASAACLNNMCIDLPSMCTDGMKNGTETDVDCGGPKCPK